MSVEVFIGHVPCKEMNNLHTLPWENVDILCSWCGRGYPVVEAISDILPSYDELYNFQEKKESIIKSLQQYIDLNNSNIARTERILSYGKAIDFDELTDMVDYLESCRNTVADLRDAITIIELLESECLVIGVSY